MRVLSTLPSYAHQLPVNLKSNTNFILASIDPSILMEHEFYNF